MSLCVAMAVMNSRSVLGPGVGWDTGVSGRTKPGYERLNMSIVVINALSVPGDAGPELEKRFAARKHSVDSSPGFEGFKLLRPVNGGDKYFVYTQWATREDFENWREQRADAAHSGAAGQKPVASGAELLEFEIVEL